jgi:phosphatidylethanolamine/phosphatidyl-N-methylethanolamine N-methyltransferase
MKAKAQLSNDMVVGAYDRWAPVYDLVFGPVFQRGRHAAIEAAEKIGGRILEVGIGTGISLRDYSPNNRIVGIDISESMLEKAKARVAELDLAHVEQLAVMDASELDFPDNAFDVVVAQYVVTTVPKPEQTLDEFARVLKPGGEIILLSRVSDETGLRRSIEHLVAPAARKLGWRTEFGWERYLAWLSRTPDIELVERRATPPFGHFSLIRFRKKDQVHTQSSNRSHKRKSAAAVNGHNGAAAGNSTHE